MADAQDRSRLADKTKNAFGIDIFAAAQRALEERGIIVPLFPEQPAQTYEEKRDANPFLAKYLPIILLGALAFFLMRRR